MKLSASKKESSIFSCSECGSVFPKWTGKCTSCNGWNTIIEEKVFKGSQQKDLGNVIEFLSFDGNLTENERIKSNLEELDRVLGGGIVIGSSILVGGEPGVGKSTLLLEVANRVSKNAGIDVLYISGEESINQIKLRGARLGISSSNLKLGFECNLSSILRAINSLKKGDVAIIDSIQTVVSEELGSPAGSIAQVRGASDEIIKCARSKGIALFLVGHINKEGQIAGPKVLEHMVDVVLYFEEDAGYHLRILRNIKNRFGSIEETGLFKMEAKGLCEISNPSELFLSVRGEDKIGNVITAGMEGTRPVMREVEVLLSPSFMSFPKRVAIGFDTNRLSMIVAVLTSHLKLKLNEKEIYINISGSAKPQDASLDLAVAVCIFSTIFEVPISKDIMCFGEVGLSGDVKPVQFMESRIKEAIKLGYTTILCPPLPETIKHLLKSAEIIEVKNLKMLRYLIK